MGHHPGPSGFLPAVAVATLASVQLGAHARSRFSLLGLLRFLAMFAVESVRGGADVARRSLGYRLHIRPGFRRYIDCTCAIPGHGCCWLTA